ncbi:MAG: TIGR02147 family protein [Bacteriovoracaceae bacterium]|jgi:uncharacterized protein (TIGR02147 family)|nr:TIGR02147 family protein [Bacteriovoracaceae bacterium]
MIFNYQNYKDYLKDRLSTKAETRGLRKKLADHLGCQSGFISQVLSGDANFSLEHIHKISLFLGLSEIETEYLINMHQKDRAGTTTLANYFEAKMQVIRKKFLNLTEHIQTTQKIDDADYALYYSDWYYSAIHLIITLNKFKDKAEIAHRLNLPEKQITEVLEFLLEKNLVQYENGKYIAGQHRIHLSKDSPFVKNNLKNWRYKTIQSISQKRDHDFFYTGNYTLGPKEFQYLKAEIVEVLKKFESKIETAPEETMACLNIDWFEL